MYKWLLRLPPSAAIFLSGLLISVATSAAAQVAFAEKSAANQNQVIASGLLAFVAGLFWFILSELIASALREIETMTPVIKSRDAAINGLARGHRAAIVGFFLLAVAVSSSWPWIGKIVHWKSVEPTVSKRGLQVALRGCGLMG